MQRFSSSGDGDSSASSSSDSLPPTPPIWSAKGPSTYVAKSATAIQLSHCKSALNGVVSKGSKSGSPTNMKLPLSSLMCPYDDDMHYAPYVDTTGMSSEDLSECQELFSKDFAELSFSIRVLSLALDPSVPILDRLKFCCIVSQNLDEHFVKRLGTIEKTDPQDFRSSRLSLRREIRPRTSHEDKLDRAIRAVVRDQYRCLNDQLLPALAAYGVQILQFEDLNDTETSKATNFFKKYVFNALTPLVIDPTHPFPRIASHSLYLCVLVQYKGNGRYPAGPVRKVFLKLPADTARLVPVDDSGLRFVPLERVAQAHIHLICRGMQILQCYVFRITRNTKMTLEDSDFIDRMDLMETVQSEIHRRRSAPPTRLEIPTNFPEDIRSLLVRELGLDDADVFVIDSPLLDLATCMSLAFVPLPQLRLVVKEPQVPRRFRGIGDSLATDPGAMFRVIKERDVLIEHPRESFDSSTLLFLAASARDPRVRSIKQVIYRAGSNSPLIQALVRAAQNGKEVTVLVELKASFDEVQNCEYANTLQNAGCNVMYGLLGLKVHSKVILVVREEPDGSMTTYANISTGNFNAKTAKLYTDISIMTCQEDICADMHDVFNSLSGYSQATEFRAALVAPVNMMDRFSQLVKEEADNARRGLPARIIAQINGLSDVVIIKELYDASQAGVSVDLFVRGACRLRPGLAGHSDNIRVFSWVGPVLQHRRIFYYFANGEEKYFIGSADWRTRNLNVRTEVAIPIFDDKIKKRLARMLIMLIDNRYLWQMDANGRYYKAPFSSEPIEFAIPPKRWVPPLSAETLANGKMSPEPDGVENLALERERQLSAGKLGPLPPDGLEDNLSTRVDMDADGDWSARTGQSWMVSPQGETDNTPVDDTSTVSLLRLNSSGGVAVSGTLERSASGAAAVDTSGEMRPSQRRSRPKPRPKYKVNIKGNETNVDKIAAGAVPVRFSDPLDISTLEVLMVQRGDIDDPWSVPKGGRNEGESPEQAAIRVAREKGGVSICEQLANLGWVLRPKRNKTIAVSTFLLKVLELGNFVNSLHRRKRKWMSFRQAIDLAVETGNSFTTDSLRRAYETCQEIFEKHAKMEEDSKQTGSVSKDAAVGANMTGSSNQTSPSTTGTLMSPVTDQVKTVVNEKDVPERSFADPAALSHSDQECPHPKASNEWLAELDEDSSHPRDLSTESLSQHAASDSLDKEDSSPISPGTREGHEVFELARDSAENTLEGDNNFAVPDSVPGSSDENAGHM